ncbi:MAG: biopolymer transporter Tol [Planctomycetota bacterium]|nr:MAG: biopolymer transporter Tol [Planctomycetota bacterium]
MLLTALLLATLVVGTRADENDRAASPTDARPARMSPEEVARREARHLKNIRQVTRCFPRAGEGYFSPDGKQIVFQAYPLGYPFYQIYRQSLEGGQPFRLSPGRGRTTCSYFHPTQPLILFASSHRDPQIEQTEAAARRLEAQGGRRRYQWDFDPWMDIYTIRPDGTGLRQLTDTPGYDAEGSYSSDGRRIVFTSTRDGDPDIYIMDADGSNVRQITNAPGYDGGPFFSPDDRWIIFRSDRRKEHMLQLFAVSVDGKHEVQLTHNLGQVNWCPYFHPSGKYIVWASADYSRGPQFANFDLFTMDVTLGETTVRTGRVERITFHRAADVLPVFSPDGKRLMWTSTRTSDGSSQLWIADWVRED